MPIIDLNLTPEQKAAVANNVSVAMGISSNINLSNSRKNVIKKTNKSEKTSENSAAVEEFNNSLQKTVESQNNLANKLSEYIDFEKSKLEEQKEIKEKEIKEREVEKENQKKEREVEKENQKKEREVEKEKKERGKIADKYINKLSTLKEINKEKDESVISSGIRRLGASGYDPKNINPGISLLAGTVSALNPFSSKSLISNITNSFSEKKSDKRNKNIQLEKSNINQDKIWLNQFAKEIEKLDSGVKNKENDEKRKQLENRISKIQSRIERRSERLSEDLTNEVIYQQQKQKGIEKPNIFKRAFNINNSRDIYKDSQDVLGMQIEETKMARPDIKASILRDVVGKESLIDAIKTNEYDEYKQKKSSTLIGGESGIKSRLQSPQEPTQKKRTYTQNKKSPLSIANVKTIASDLASTKVVFSKGGTPTTLGQYIAGTYYKLSGLEESLSKQGPAINYQEGSKSGSGFLGSMLRLGTGAIVSKIAGSMLGKLVTKVPLLNKIPFIGKNAAKTVGKEGLELGGKTVLKTAGKSVSKSVGKSLLKKIPLIGAAAGIGFGIQRAMRGDMFGAAGEVASGLASTVPGIGTGASIGIDAMLLGRDLSKTNKPNQNINKPKEIKNNVSQPYIESNMTDSIYTDNNKLNTSLIQRQPVITTQSNNSIIASDVKNQEVIAELFANKIGDKLIQILKSDIYKAEKTKEIRMQGTEISSATFNV